MDWSPLPFMDLFLLFFCAARESAFFPLMFFALLGKCDGLVPFVFFWTCFLCFFVLLGKVPFFPLCFFAAWENAESAEVALRVETADPSNASHIFESVWNKDDI